jgi:hypothetical protein
MGIVETLYVSIVIDGMFTSRRQQLWPVWQQLNVFTIRYETFIANLYMCTVG